jgi:hypothetical protein
VAQRHGLLASLLALAIPVPAGLAYMAVFGAPPAYIAINAGALALALLWMAAGPVTLRPLPRRLLAGGLLAVLALPLLTGPELNGVTRWVPIGPATLHTGMLTLPTLAVIAAQEREDAPPLLLSALFLALLQPDAASAFAITFAAVGMHHLTRDWRMGVVAIAGFVTAIAAALRGELPAQPFVERVLVEAIDQSLLAALALFCALLASFLLILFHGRPNPVERFALAGTLFGFAIMSLMSNYPTPLIGYGAAPILGYGLALGFRQESRS